MERCHRTSCSRLNSLLTFITVLGALGSAGAIPNRAKPLEIYFVDVEGGQATLIVSPSGESLLVDTGWEGFNGRDADRIVAATRLAHLKRIDYLLISHFHADHVGGVPQLAARIPIVTFLDHGSNVETTEDAKRYSAAYALAVTKGNHRVVRPGDLITLKEVEVKVVTANGDIVAPLRHAQLNPYCTSTSPMEDDPSENARSVGILVSFGHFRFIDLSDLTWNKELSLMCPVNRVGTVDLYLTSHHGIAISGSKPLVWALRPRVAIMNNGARKGGQPSAWQIVRESPQLEDFWQLHFSVEGGKDHNTDGDYIANVDENCEGKYLKVSAERDGSFVVTNSRNGFTKNYGTRH